MDDKKNKERQLFTDALELPDSDRLPFLEQACKDDVILLQRVLDLLNAYSNESSVLRTTSSGDLEHAEVEDVSGTTLGRYKLLQKIGEGGMGVVYMAEQTDPVIRKVALKIIKWGMDTKNVVARFEAERQALAMMDHPNIAKVLDAGATENGRPYFVMELVQGVPITEYCEKNRLNTRDRIQLLTTVCQAIQSAHHKGIIHRDIKPSNVLVSFLHGETTVKVIDFGIAKATNQKLTEKTLFTNFATMIGTPAYMSPEQAKMSVIDIDSRTDVYSLGVLLYELLTGSTPFTEKRLRSLGYGEIQRVIADEEPEKPSTRISKTLAVGKSDSEKMPPVNNLPNSSIDSDLDWITMKCLEKDRRRRYNTVSALGDDLQRHLNDEPVDAAAPTFSYQLAKLYKRHQAYARLVIGTVLLLIVATVF
ncbi:serine/threonine protein kinase, partial [bacterium]|nr:serine/threonine protein kinase [bacterium]